MTAPVSDLAAAETGSFPALPPPVLALGITGHREANAALAANADAIAALFDTLYGQIAAAAGDASIRLTSLLADGSDQLAARAALARGWDLAVPLPFGEGLNLAINAHAETVADAAALMNGGVPADPATAARAAAIADLCAHARLFALADEDDRIAPLLMAALAAPSGQRAAPALTLSHAVSRRVAMAGRVMIEQCDLLIAVWDGRSRAAVGGTGHTLASALELGAPVVLVDPADPAGWRIVTTIEDLAGDAGRDGREATLAALVRAALHPVDGGHHGAHGHGDGAAMLVAPGAWRARSNPMFHPYRRIEALFGGEGRPWRALRLHYETPDAVASGSGAPVLAALGGLPGGDAGLAARVRDAVLRRFALADGISTHLSDLYRGGMTANFLASGAAVVAGMAYLPTVGPAWKWVCALAEFLLLATILTNIWLARRGHWHDRWFETRRAAEYLRHAPILLALGAARAPGRWPRASGAGWPEHHARHALRQVGLPAMTVTRPYLHAALARLIDSHVVAQRDYHRAKARRLDHVHHGLDGLSARLFQLAVASVAIWLSLWAGGALHLLPADLAEHLSKLFTFLGVLFPTFGATIAGIRYFADFDRFAAISRISAERLDALHRRAATLLAAGEDALDHGVVADLARAADDVVVAEIESWQSVFAGKHFTVPV